MERLLWRMGCRPSFLDLNGSSYWRSLSSNFNWTMDYLTGVGLQRTGYMMLVATKNAKVDHHRSIPFGQKMEGEVGTYVEWCLVWESDGRE